MQLGQDGQLIQIKGHACFPHNFHCSCEYLIYYQSEDFLADSMII